MADPIDQERANIAMRLAVTRWRKGPDDSIAAKLDDPQEWLMESALMNRYLPGHVKPKYSFMAVVPNEFSVGIKLVRQYAGLIYKHMVPVTVAETETNFSAHFGFEALKEVVSADNAPTPVFSPFGGE